MTKPFIIGHRGCRGLYPENTIEGFKIAQDLGVDLIEMDVMVTGENQIVVTHDPYPNPDYCLTKEGKEIDWEVNFYEMGIKDIQNFDCGSKAYPAFPMQENIPEKKPLLSSVFREVKAKWLIEIKSSLFFDNIFHPIPDEYVSMVLDCIKDANVKQHVILQSFDKRILEEVHLQAPEIMTAYLVEDEDPLAALADLGYTPEVFAPEHSLITEELLAALPKKMKVFAWTVNELDRAQELVNMGVEGIITDYPDMINSDEF